VKIEKTGLGGVLRVIPPTIFEDHRGSYIETYNEKIYKEAGVDIHFVQDDISMSRKNVLRGIHGDVETWKLVSCLYGEFYLVVVNCDKDSSDFGKWESFNLSDKNRNQVLIPPKYGNGHLILSEQAIFHYKQSTYYNPKGQFTYKWNDPQLKISWPVKEPILSERDKVGHYV
jgi:dTDP-4-dehydrorhamnose 3,5-epimerase